MTKRIIILGASHFHTRTIELVQELGYEVHVLDKNPSAPGFASTKFHEAIDIMDRFAVLNYAKKNGVDGIMPLNDFGTRSAFYASQKLNLISPSYLSGICGNDKGIMREIWAHDHLPQPKFIVFDCRHNDDVVPIILSRLEFPLVVKPCDVGGAGRGISVAFNKREIDQSIAHATNNLTQNRRLIVEEFVQGTEVTVDSLVYKGVTSVLAISDKYKPESRYRVATSLNFPAYFEGGIIEEVKKLTIKANESLGISNGATHAEIIVGFDGRLSLVEIGIRGGGGHIFSTIVEAVSTVCAPQELAKILCGETPSLEIKKNKGCVYRFFNPKGSGVIKRVEVDKEVFVDSSVLAFSILANPGDLFFGLTDSTKRVGFVVTIGNSREEAIASADRIEKSVRFVFES